MSEEKPIIDKKVKELAIRIHDSPDLNEVRRLLQKPEYIGKVDEITLGAAVNKATSVAEVKDILQWPEFKDVKANEITLGITVNKATSISEVKEILQWPEFKDVKVDEITLGATVNKATSVAEVKEILQWPEFKDVKVNEVTLGATVNKATSVAEVKEILQWPEFKDVKVNEVTLGAAVNKANTIAEAKEVLRWFRENHKEVRPNEVIMNILYNRLIRTRRNGKINTSDLLYIENFFLDDKKLEDEVQNDPRTQIVRSICFFAVGDHKGGVENIQKVLMSKKLNTKDIERTAITVFAFLPPNHQLYILTKTVLTSFGLFNMIQNAEDYSRNFWDIIDNWEKEADQELKARFSNSSSLFELGGHGINSLANRVTFKSSKL